jgi:WD40 repeat protein
MSDGIVNVWDANTLLNGRPETALLSSSERHRASVKAIQFNPHPTATHLLAAASVDGDISIINLENPSAPTVASYVLREMEGRYSVCSYITPGL